VTRFGAKKKIPAAHPTPALHRSQIYFSLILTRNNYSSAARSKNTTTTKKNAHFIAMEQQQAPSTTTTTAESATKKRKFADTKMDVDYLTRPEGVELDAEFEPAAVGVAPGRVQQLKNRPIPFAAGAWGSHRWVTVSEDGSEVTFKMQKGGPCPVVGENGTYVDDIILFARELLQEYSVAYPSRETSLAITKLDEALMWNFKRAANRHFAGLHGTGKPSQ
jgi:hypothetical protein